MHYFKDVTLLVTHYNRSGSLERLLDEFKKLNCKFDDIVVSDDGSEEKHLDAVRSFKAQFGFRLITTPLNRGLGNNINKGQDAVNTSYTLYVQEDFIPGEHFPAKFEKALVYMNERSDLDMVRFYAYFKYPFLKSVDNDFSEMLFNAWPWYWGYRKFYYYSDHPHLRRSNFFERFGKYAEGLKGDVTQYKMMMSLLKKKSKSLFYEHFHGLFEQVNSDAEPSTMKRNMLRESNHLLIVMIRHLYRHLKFNLDFHLKH